MPVPLVEEPEAGALAPGLEDTLISNLSAPPGLQFSQGRETRWLEVFRCRLFPLSVPISFLAFRL